MSAARPLVRPAVEALAPYQPGKPIEEVQRELGLERVIKLASNEGPFPPFPAALEAIEAAARGSNRYPDGSNHRLQQALAKRHDVPLAQVCAGAGADGCLDVLSQALLEAGDEVVCGWPSFASYPIYAAKQAAATIKVPLREGRYDLEALAAAIGPRTKIVYVCHPNNPTGTANTTAELDAFVEQLPAGVLAVVDQAYFEYVQSPDYPDAVERYVKQGRRVLVLRTFSKIYGLAGLRVGYGVGPEDVCAAMAKLRRPFDVSSCAQAAALASIGQFAELAERRERNAAGRVRLEQIMRAGGLEPLEGAVANFLYADTGAPAAELFDALLRQGVVVRPLAGFGAPEAVRITVGSDEELDQLAAALGRVRRGG